jgi:hypothetical protein
MATSDVVFWAVAGPFLAVWVVLGVRYTQANRKWFDRLMLVEASSSGTESAIDRFLRRVPRRPRIVYTLAFGLSEVLRRPFRMFRLDADPELERLRQEAVARSRPLLSVFAVGAAVWLALTVIALGVIVARVLLA